MTEWPVTFEVEDGRRFEVRLVATAGGQTVEMRVSGSGEWRGVGDSYGE